ncbi:MAG TPA: glycine--tRNA ligase [Solirubrobacterales bacterium]|nr:glycine--tRNA ligase [Solirubrobacterales bacterium]
MAAAEEKRPTDVSMEEIVALCKRRGFVFPSSEIYGGLGSTYDYGHYGVLLKNNVKAEWWRAMLQERDDIVALDSAILQHPRVWEASGHLEGFTDPLVQCLGKCKKRWREDHLREAVEAEGGDPSAELRCPECGGELSEPRQFNLMFETHVGPVACEGSEVYLRPETAQGIFINFKNVLGFARKKPPFGIAQIGKSFRNEITPGNFIFRTREFEQMEMEFFVPPADAERWYRTWIKERERWYTELGIRPEFLRVRPHDKDELSHYSSGTSDVEYLFPIGWSELEGIANRGDFDLTQHAKFSGEKLEYFDQQAKESYVPHVIEPAAGADRATLAFLVDAYDVEEVEGRQRTVLRLHPKLAPVKVAVLPLVSKEGMPEKAREIFKDLRTRLPAEFDEGGSIGKRYRRQDEIGTPWGITVDHQTMEDDTVTLRDRDSLEQARVPIAGLGDELAARLAQPWRSPKLDN